MKINKYLLLILLICLPLGLAADTYDPDNYPPDDPTVSIGRTNLPIIFIDTRCGGDSTKAIHKDYRIAARMKIINNIGRWNYGDTLAYRRQVADYDGWIAIRYRGNTSFFYSTRKPYNFKTMMTDDPDGDKRNTELLGMPRDNTWVLLAPKTDRSLLRDVLMFQLARPWFEYTPRCCFCELVLDGVYYGIYVLAENIRKGENRLNLNDPGVSGDALTGGYLLQIDRNEENYFTSKYPAVDSLGRPYRAYNKIYFQYKHPDYEDMLPKQIDYIQQQVNLMEDVLAGDDFADSLHGYRQYLDELSFIDQQLSQEVSGNVDGYRLSTNIYKRRDSQDPRFKTALWDFNLAFANSSSNNAKGTDFWRFQNSYITNYNAANKVPFWWMRLMEDSVYVKHLKERWTEYRNGNYNIDRIYATIDSLTTVLKRGGALTRNFTAWRFFVSSTYDMEIDLMKNWIAERIAWMDQELEYEPTIVPNNRFKKTIEGYYNISGQRLQNPPQKGFYIVSYRDGTFMKILARPTSP